jgi:hypothetical protein
MHSSKLSNSEYAPFYSGYVQSVGNVDLFSILENSYLDLVETLQNLPEEKLVYRYADGKWTIKELVQHIIDAERVLSYRALRFSRNDASDLPGYNEDWYVYNSNGNERNFSELLNEFNHLRQATIALFKSFTPDMLKMIGSANQSDMSVRALGFIIAGHQMHHLKVIKDLYL